MKKLCTKCGHDWPLEAFHKDVSKPDGKHSQCKYCHSRRNKDKRLADPAWRDHQNQQSRNYRKNNKAAFKESTRWATIKLKYGITKDQYMEILDKQSNQCKICGNESPGVGKFKYLHVDHSHETGDVRGLLCQSCNTALGHMKESPDLLRSAAQYLESWGG